LGAIAFRRFFDAGHHSGAIFTVNVDGRGDRQVSHAPSVMDFDGSSPRLIAPFGYTAHVSGSSAAFSPGGKLVLFWIRPRLGDKEEVMRRTTTTTPLPGRARTHLTSNGRRHPTTVS
jgi:hypothetical protein